MYFQWIFNSFVVNAIIGSMLIAFDINFLKITKLKKILRIKRTDDGKFPNVNVLQRETREKKLIQH